MKQRAIKRGMSVVTNLENFKSGCTLEKLRIATKITATEYIIYKLVDEKWNEENPINPKKMRKTK